jgi:hypothetical protein
MDGLSGSGRVRVRHGKYVKGFATRGAAIRMDGRGQAARYMRRIRLELAAHVGGQPSTVQKAIIERLAWLALHMARIDARSIETGEMSDHARREYLAWSNTYARLMTQLGLHPTAVHSQSLQDYLAKNYGQSASDKPREHSDTARCAR